MSPVVRRLHDSRGSFVLLTTPAQFMRIELMYTRSITSLDDDVCHGTSHIHGNTSSFLCALFSLVQGPKFFFKLLAPVIEMYFKTYGPKIQIRASQASRVIHRALVHLCLQSADTDGIERLHRTVQRQLHDIQVIRKERASISRGE